MAGQCGAFLPATGPSEVGRSWTDRSGHQDDLLFTNYLQSADSGRAVCYIRNDIKAAISSESLVFERLCAIQARGHVRAANV